MGGGSSYDRFVPDNPYAAAARARKVAAIVAAMVALDQVAGDIDRIDVDQLYEIPTAVLDEFCTEVAGVRPASRATWAQVAAEIRIMRRVAALAPSDPFANL